MSAKLHAQQTWLGQSSPTVPNSIRVSRGRPRQDTNLDKGELIGVVGRALSMTSELSERMYDMFTGCHHQCVPTWASTQVDGCTARYFHASGRELCGPTCRCSGDTLIRISLHMR
jgi:hypothetical protein